MYAIINLLNQTSNCEQSTMFKVLIEYFLLQALKVMASLWYITAFLIRFDLNLTVIVAGYSQTVEHLLCLFELKH
jgi:hypothetical protein